jgi:hypothetical protein
MHLDFEIGGVKYRAGKLNPFEQFNILRKLAPVFAAVASTAESGVMAGLISGESEADLAKLLPPVLQGLADLPEEDANAVLFGCLRAVQRESGAGYAPVMAQGAQRLMFEDIDLPVMLQLAWKVLEHNLSGFFQGKVAGGALPTA